MHEKKIASVFYAYDNFNDLSQSEKDLVNEAQQALLNAHAPYSKFKVGAAVELEDGTIVCGNNQENAAYPSGLCAERVALFYASSKYPDKRIKSIAVMGKSEKSHQHEHISPCGGCRQVIAEYEFKQKSTIKMIFMGNKNNYFICEGISHLLPLAFH